jgi:hypothetical protein
MSEEKQPRKKSSVRHTRAIQKNRISQPVAAPTDEQIREHIQEIVHPATLVQVSYFHRLGLPERTLSLVVMVAYMLEMVWYQIGSVSGLARIVQKKPFCGNNLGKSANKRCRSD